MRPLFLTEVIVGLFLFGAGGPLMASEADELRERAKILRHDAIVMADHGKQDEAERLKQESLKLLEASERLDLAAKGRDEEGDRPGIDKEVRHLKGRLQDLIAHEKKMRDAKAPEKDLAAVREHISRIERELEKLRSRHAGPSDIPPEFRPQVEKLAEAGRRIHHLRAAAENLKVAEAHDLAQQVMEKAERMEREVQQEKKRLEAEMRNYHPEDRETDVVRELRSEIERLRTEVEKLRQKVEER